MTTSCVVTAQNPNPQTVESPAAQPLPPTATPQEYPEEQVEAGRVRFGAACGFCHGRDTAGGVGGTDLTRSELVAADVRGDRIGPVVRDGRADLGMPAIALTDDDLAAVVAFIHTQKTQAETVAGGRRRVAPADLRTGDADAGRQYFETRCTTCHSAGGDLAGVASRHEGLALLQRLLYPRPDGQRPGPATVIVTLPGGDTVTGALAYRDEFTIGLTDADGWYRSWSTDTVRVEIDDPLQTHVDELAIYTDEDMHDVLAYLQTLL